MSHLAWQRTPLEVRLNPYLKKKLEKVYISAYGFPQQKYSESPTLP